MARRPKTFAPEPDPVDLAALYREKIASSGIDDAQAAALGLSAVTKAEACAMGLWPKYGGLDALLIPYHDPFTGAPLSVTPKAPPYVRARFLGPPPPGSDKDDGFGKYTQPPVSGVAPYFPRVAGLDWRSTLEDPTAMLLITEGELKAAKACTEGFATVGLGGVWNWRSKTPQLPFLPLLERVNWVRRHVCIVYDSDIAAKPQVLKAAWELACQLEARGAFPHLGVIKAAEGEDKVGLDDLLVRRGPPSLWQVIGEAVGLGMVHALWDLNERYAALEEGDREVVDAVAGEKIKFSQLEYRVTAKYHRQAVAVSKRMEIISFAEDVNAAKAWIDWPLRRTARRVDFDPALPPLAFVANGRGGQDFNAWPGFAVAPAAGDVSPFLALLDRLFEGADPGDREWFLDWLAYPLQHPGAKMATAAVVVSRVMGVGKSLLGVTMGRIYGSAYGVIGNRELKGTDNHNEWAIGKLFVMGDEISPTNRREAHDNLKAMITQERLRINPKHLSAYTLPDRINYLFTSNRADAFVIDDGDRRFFIHEVSDEVVPHPDAFYAAYERDFLGGAGPAALLAWLLARDVSAFNPMAKARATASKTRMRDETMSPAERWARDLRAGAFDEGFGGSDLRTFAELLQAYCMAQGIDATDRDARQALRYGLRDAGLRQVLDGGQVKRDGQPVRLYPVRDFARWGRATLDDVRSHLDGGAKGKVVQLKKRRY